MFNLAARPRRKVLLLLLDGVLLGTTLRAQEHPSAPNPPPELKAVRTIEPSVLRLSTEDRLSGGLSQAVLFRIANDKQGRILVTDPHLSLIQVLDIENGKRFQLKADKLNGMVFPTYIAVDGDDNIYVSDPIRGVVLEFFPDGRLARAIGGSELALPFGLAIDRSTGRLFVVDHERAMIVVYSLEGKFLNRFASFGSATGELSHPTEIAFENGVLYVLDTGNARFEAFDSAGRFKAVLPFGDNRLSLAFAVDQAGRLYCVDGLSLGVLVLDQDGNQIASFAVQRPQGQPNSVNRAPVYTSLAIRADGALLALRPNLTIDVLKLDLSPAIEPAK